MHLWDAKFARAQGGLLTSQNCSNLHWVFPKQTSGRNKCLQVQPKAPYPGSGYASSSPATRHSLTLQQTGLPMKWQTPEVLHLKSCSLCPSILESPVAVRKGKLLRCCAGEPTWTVPKCSSSFCFGRVLTPLPENGQFSSVLCSEVPLNTTLPFPQAYGSARCGEWRLSNKTYCCQQFKSS